MVEVPDLVRMCSFYIMRTLGVRTKARHFEEYKMKDVVSTLK